MKKLKSLVISLVLVVSAIVLSACGWVYPQLETDAKPDMNGKFVASSSTDMQTALGEKLTFSKKGYHITLKLKSDSGESYVNNYAKLDETGKVHEFAGITTEKYVTKDGYSYQMQIETYIKDKTLYVSFVAKGKGVRNGKQEVLNKKFTYKTSFNGEFSSSDDISQFTGLDIDYESMQFMYMFLEGSVQGVLENNLNVVKSINGATTKFKTTIADYSKVDKFTTTVSKFKDNMIVTNKVVTGIEFETDMKYSKSSTEGNTGFNLDGLSLSYVEFNDDIEYADGLNKYSNITPSLIEVNSYYEFITDLIEAEGNSFGFNFNIGDDDSDDNTGDDGTGDNTGDNGTGDNAGDDDTEFTYVELEEELGTSEEPKIDLSQNVYKITYTNKNYFDESGEILFKYGDETDIWGDKEISELKSAVTLKYENETGSILTTINADFYNDTYYFKMTAVGNALINGNTKTINETYTYSCPADDYYYSYTYNTISLYNALYEAASFSIEDMYDNIDSVIEAQGEDCDISKSVVSNGNKYVIDLTEVLNAQFSKYDGSCEKNREEFIVKNNSLVKYSLIRKQSVLSMTTDRTFTIEEIGGTITHNITSSEYSETEPDITEVNYFIDVMENPDLENENAIEYTELVADLGSSTDPNVSFGNNVYEVSSSSGVDMGEVKELVSTTGLVIYAYNEIEAAKITTVVELGVEESELKVTIYTNIVDEMAYIKVVAVGNCDNETINETHTYKCSLNEFINIMDTDESGEFSYLYLGYQDLSYFYLESLLESVDSIVDSEGEGYLILKEESTSEVTYNISTESSTLGGLSETFIIENDIINDYEYSFESIIFGNMEVILSKTTKTDITYSNLSSYSETLPDFSNIDDFVSKISAKMEE